MSYFSMFIVCGWNYKLRYFKIFCIIAHAFASDTSILFTFCVGIHIFRYSEHMDFSSYAIMFLIAFNIQPVCMWMVHTHWVWSWCALYLLLSIRWKCPFKVWPCTEKASWKMDGWIDTDQISQKDVPPTFFFDDTKGPLVGLWGPTAQSTHRGMTN